MISRENLRKKDEPGQVCQTEMEHSKLRLMRVHPLLEPFHRIWLTVLICWPSIIASQHLQLIRSQDPARETLKGANHARRAMRTIMTILPNSKPLPRLAVKSVSAKMVTHGGNQSKTQLKSLNKDSSIWLTKRG